MIHVSNPLAEYLIYKTQIDEVLNKFLGEGDYILGKSVEAFESDFARYLGVREVIGVANATDALELVLQSLNVGIGDEVITVSFTALATVAAIHNVGAIPVLVDIDPHTLNVDPNEIRKAITRATKAIVLVHLHGNPAPIDEVLDLGEKNNVPIVEDCSQAHGATFAGSKLGTFGIASCFSCYPTKNLSALGDAGIIATNDEALAEIIRCRREYGWDESRVAQTNTGRNSRLDGLQAAILSAKLGHLDGMNSRRRKIAAGYIAVLQNSRDINPPEYNSDAVYHQFVIRSPVRKDLIALLTERNVGTGIHYQTPVHLHPAYKSAVVVKGDMQYTELASREVLSIPVRPSLSDPEVKLIISVLMELGNEIWTH